MSAAVPEPPAERPSPDHPRTLKSSVVEILAATANGCLTELGYFPGMPQRLQQLERQNTELRSANEKLFQDNQSLVRALQERTDTASPQHTINAWKNKVSALSLEITRLKDQYNVLSAGQPYAYQQLLADYRKLQNYYSTALQEIAQLRNRISLQIINSQAQARGPPSISSQTIPTPPATHGRPSPLAIQSPQPQVPTANPQSIPSGSQQLVKNAPTASPFNQQGMYVFGNNGSIQNQNAPFLQQTPSGGPGPVRIPGHPNAPPIDLKKMALSSQAPRTVNIPPLVPNLPMVPSHPPQLSVDTRVAPVVQNTEQRGPNSAHARLQTGATSPSNVILASNSPRRFSTLYNLAPARPSFHSANGSGVASTSKGHTLHSRAVSLPRITTIEREPGGEKPPFLPTDVADGRSFVNNVTSDPSSAIEPSTSVTGDVPNTLTAHPRSPTRSPSPTLIRGSLKRSHSSRLNTNNLGHESDTKRQRLLGDESHEETPVADLQGADQKATDNPKDNDVGEDEEIEDEEIEIEIGPDGLRLVEDCLAALIEIDATNPEVKSCKLCIARFKMGIYNEEPKPFIRSTTEELAEHCSSEHHDAWNTLRHDV